MNHNESYQGWKNWSTWNVALWVNNECELYESMRKLRPVTPRKARLFLEHVMPGGTKDMEGERRLFPPYCLVDWKEIADDFNSD